MNNPQTSSTTRREFLSRTGGALIGASLAIGAAKPGYAAEKNELQTALIGCGGRGTRAASNALATRSGPIRLVAMGRMAVHTGQVVTWEQMLNHSHEFDKGLDRLRTDSPAPLQAGTDGKYPLPQPGRLGDREF